MTPCLSALAVLLIALFIVRAATRLDRLHVRTDAAWAALDGLLARRAVVVRTLAAAGCLPPAASDGFRMAADRALTVGPVDREAAENELGGLLAMLDRESLKPGPATELADAEQRLVIARRVYNDAVRDTRALRGRRGVRWLRLAGTAPRPRFFEITEPPGTAPSLPVRAAARILLVDHWDQVLLFRCLDPRGPLWFTPGGGQDPGEELRTTAVRELAEETGLVVSPEALTGPVWYRQAVFPVSDCEVDGREWFFLLRVHEHEVDTSGFDELERASIIGHRWWSVEDLAAARETIYPKELARALPTLLAAPWDGTIRPV